ncbi:MAG: hypothetical protein ACTSYA_07680 [Candidatus Kariarchaeaceae archaeon]
MKIMTTKDYSWTNEILTVTQEQQEKVNQLLDETRIEPVNFWELNESFYVPVDDGEIKVYHIKPQNPTAKRVLVYVTGWGAIKESFTDWYETIHEKVECYYVESREKGSSKLKRNAKMDMHQQAKDIQAVINYVDLKDKDFVLAGTCWGSAIIMQGLVDNTISAPSIAVLDPMHQIWAPRWLKILAPILPVFIYKLLKPILKWFALRKMKAQRQKERIESFVDNADLRKWKKAGLAALKDYELFGKLDKVEQEVFVVNCCKDMIHDQLTFPQVAFEMPLGRFLFMNTEESNRERLMGRVCLEFANVNQEDSLPESLQMFEKKLPR